jgi:hypothetical protein
MKTREMAATPSGELHAISKENTLHSRPLKLTFSIHTAVITSYILRSESAIYGYTNLQFRL